MDQLGHEQNLGCMWALSVNKINEENVYTVNVEMFAV